MSSAEDGYFGSNARQAAARRRRIADFTTEGAPRSDSPCDLLCEDHVGTYLLPFPCIWTGTVWKRARSGELIESRVVGWKYRQTIQP